MIVETELFRFGLPVTCSDSDYGSAGSPVTPRMEPSLHRARAGHLDGGGSAGTPCSAPPPPRPTHLVVHQTHSAERSLRVPRRASAGRILERGAESSGGWVRARSSELGAGRWELGDGS